ncbi:hypothetical protein EMGBS3_11970 [Anaerolineaceae bacterium]|nr:hypothetical protein EMGBS3_11970 [Anaerolineaceae bacterium]
MNRAETALVQNDRKTFLNCLLLTVALGTLFLAGVVVFEWGGHIRPSDGAYGAVLFGMTGMHALHVVSGIVFILIVWNNGRRGLYSSEQHWAWKRAPSGGIMLIWCGCFFYPALYLMGQAVH